MAHDVDVASVVEVAHFVEVTYDVDVAHDGEVACIVEIHMSMMLRTLHMHEHNWKYYQCYIIEMCCKMKTKLYKVIFKK